MKKNQLKWIVLFFVLILMFLTMFYTDIMVTYSNGLALLDCISDGNLLNFYDYIPERSYFSPYQYQTPGYDLPIYIIFAVWNLPVWILERVGICDIWEVGCLLWCKGLVVLFYGGCCFLMAKLIKAVSMDENWAIFLYASSLLVVLPVFAAAQYDIIPVFFILLALLEWYKAGRASWVVIAIFAWAIPLKFFAALPFIILLLLTEKRICYILRNLLLGFSGYILNFLLFYGHTGFGDAKAFQGGIWESLVSVCFEGGEVGISSIACCLFVSWLIAYLLKPQTRKELLLDAVWLIFFDFFTFFLFYAGNTYWIVLLAPFLVLLIIQNKETMRVNFLLEFIFTGSILAVKNYLMCWVYCSDQSFSHLILKSIIGKDFLGISNFTGIINYLTLDKYMPAVNAAFAVSGGALLWINNPWKRPTFENEGEKNISIIEKSVLIGRLSCLVLYFLIMFLITFWL